MSTFAQTVSRPSRESSSSLSQLASSLGRCGSFSKDVSFQSPTLLIPLAQDDHLVYRLLCRNTSDYPTLEAT